MTRYGLKVVCFLSLFIGIVMLLVWENDSHERRKAMYAITPVPLPAASVMPEQFSVDISELAEHLDEMPQKEVDDQLRDWAVYGAISQLGLTDDEATRAWKNAPPMRLPYLEDAFSYDYGRGRRVILDEKGIFLFYEKSDPDPMATLGRLGDRVRMEIGETPSVVQVIEFEPDLGAGAIHFVRKPDISGADLFGPRYGYVEAIIEKREDLENWLGQIDDVVMARADGGQLILGGRRFEKSRTQNVRLEDIAALFQAHEWLDGQRAKRDQAVAKIDRELQQEVERRTEELNRKAPIKRKGYAQQEDPALELWRKLRQKDSPSILSPDLDTPRFYEDLAELLKPNGRRERLLGGLQSPRLELSEAEVKAIFAKYVPRLVALPLVPEDPGFSLDPRWDPQGLVTTLETLRHKPCQSMSDFPTAEDSTLSDLLLFLASKVEGNCKSPPTSHKDKLSRLIRDVKAAGSDAIALERAMQPIWEMKAEEDLTAQHVADVVNKKHRIQCARYDGPLDGTRVGMYLFYTDLLAKLWQSVDHHHSAPAAMVPGFISRPRMRLEAEWEDELKRLPHTRIWFGPRPEGYSVNGEARALWFEHIATRVFSAGSNPLKPGEEEQPNEASRRSIGWWDRHYADVADYEQAYHIQNQIIKWSLITASKRQQLSFLGQVPVRRDHRFDTWHEREKPNLRFQEKLPLFPRTRWVGGTECMPLLESYAFSLFGADSYTIEGGVSAGGRRALEAARRLSSGIDVPKSERLLISEAKAKLPGTASRSLPTLQKSSATSSAKVVSKLSSETRTRVGKLDLKLSSIDFEAQKQGLSKGTLRINSNEGPIGEFGFYRTHQGRLALKWQPKQVDLARWPQNSAQSQALSRTAHQALEASNNESADAKPAEKMFEALHNQVSRQGLKEFGQAVEKQNPSKAELAKQLREELWTQGDRLFNEGRFAEATKAYELQGEEIVDAPPKAQVQHALAEILSGKPSQGLERLKPTLTGPDFMLRSEASKHTELKALLLFLDARDQPQKNIFGLRTASFELKPLEGKLTLELQTNEPVPSELLTTAERIALIERPSRLYVDEPQLYVDERIRMNKVDWANSGAGTLAEMAKSPSVIWRRAAITAEGFKPSSLVENGMRYKETPTFNKAELLGSSKPASNAYIICLADTPEARKACCSFEPPEKRQACEQSN